MGLSWGARFSFVSLRARLMLLVILALVPALVLIFHDGLQQKHRAAAEAKVEAMRLVGFASTSQKQLVDEVHQLLTDLSKEISGCQDRPSECNALLSSLLKEHPRYVNFGVASLDGSVFCSAIPILPSDGHINIADHHYFQRALQTRDFAVGSYQIDRIAKTFTINFGQPLLSERGDVGAVLFAALDLAYLVRAAAQAQLPEGAVLTIRDSAGTILFRYPDHAEWFGRSLPEAPIVKSIVSQQGWGTAEAAGVDGVQRLYAFAPLSSSMEPSVYLSVGIESKTAFSKADRQMNLNLACLGGVALLALLAAWYGGNLLIMSPVHGLIQVSRKLATGDMSARCGTPYGRTELGELAHVFDEMAESLDQRTSQLRKAEIKYRTLVEQLPAITYIMAAGEFGKVLYVSPQVETILGFSPAEWIGESELWLRQLHPHDRDRVVQERSRRTLSGETLKSEYRLFAKDGHAVWIRDEAQVFPGEDDHPLTIQGIMRDVSDRKFSEEALRWSEEAFRRLSRQNELILESAGEGILGLDSQGKVTFINPAATKMVGWNIGEVIGRSHHEMVHHTKPDGTNYPKSDCPVYAALRDGNIHRASDEVFWRKDGTSFPIEYVSTPIREGEEIVGAVVSFRDITERKQAEADLRRSEEHFRSLIENSLDIITVVDAAGAIRYQSPSVERILGYLPQEMIGMNAFEFIHPEDVPKVGDGLEEVVGVPGSLASMEFRFRHKDGSWRTLEAIARNHLHDPAVTGVVVNSRDITEREALKTKLVQAQKMEAIGALAGGIAHDFNNILGAIYANVEMAKEKLAEEGIAQGHLDQVLKASCRAKELVKQILTFSRKSEQRRMPVELALVIKEALKLLRASLPSTIKIRQTISISPCERPGLVIADPTEIHQVLMNLCTNAAQAMGEKGGVLEVSLVDVHIDADAAGRVPGISPGSYLRLTVSDTGHGIDSASFGRIFDPFYTTKGPGEGTGMGLAVVHGIAASCGGGVVVESELGKGSAFHVFLPWMDAAQQDLHRQRKVQHGSPVPPPGGRERILFVDDEEMMVKIWAEILSGLGYDITSTTSSVEALHVFRTHPDHFDLVITDQTMPNLTGVDLAREMLSLRPDIPIILITGYSEMIDDRRAKVLGIQRLAVKPVAKQQMAVIIREVLDKSPRTSCPEMA